jgi:hypothetical protein
MQPEHSLLRPFRIKIDKRDSGFESFKDAPVNSEMTLVKLVRVRPARFFGAVTIQHGSRSRTPNRRERFVFCSPGFK